MTQHDPDVEVIRRYCPYYTAATQMLARRWAAGVLRALVTGPARFSDIAAAIPGMTDKLLSQRLKTSKPTDWSNGVSTLARRCESNTGSPRRGTRSARSCSTSTVGR
jgi:hypothetical protein